MTSPVLTSFFDLKNADDIRQSKDVIGSSIFEEDSRESSISDLSDSSLTNALPIHPKFYQIDGLCSRTDSTSTLNPSSIDSIVTTACGANGTYSEGYTGSFEGPEKLLEIWFANNMQDSQNLHSHDSDLPGLRSIPLESIKSMLLLVNCTILESFSNNHCDAYLLSESSLFVYPNKMIIKTCGTTTLLLALQRILDLSNEFCGHLSPFKIFYSRKSFMFPDLQPQPHNSWDNEVEYLNTFFSTGAAYIIGNLNSDYWHLYIASPTFETHSPSSPSLSIDSNSQLSIVSNLPRSTIKLFKPAVPLTRGDTTIEILMTGLDPERMKLLYCGHLPKSVEGLEGGKFVENITGISDIYPEAEVSSYLFSPCGLSSNGLLGSNYFTIHVTPEISCSYASFETNVPLSNPSSDDINTLVSKVVKIFGPSQFTVTSFFHSEDDENDDDLIVSKTNSPVNSFITKKRLGEHVSTDRIHYELDDYHLYYSHFVKS
ncbi:S-adenosylmethionine decarboxylase proenzyme [Smittium mucronatum]|uniref:adenosylmethionine decarboxylase n=1 Tax=Smittium mucronatum TaxID=133383 RepID=A0A1R0GTN8_9FUNG|nr:S-adenosylmethionine decarboxylase proenzyme [Smittium mucronatum]